MNVLITLGLLWAGSAAAADLVCRVEPLAGPPRGTSAPLYMPPVPIRRVQEEPRLDGLFDDPVWRTAIQADPPRALRNRPPPDPGWRAYALATPGGLALALRGLPQDVRSDIAIDPDGSRQGWVRLRLEAGDATLQDCRATPSLNDMPFRHAWNVDAWPCGVPAPAQAQHGAHGWELLIPWSALERTTDDLRVQWWADDGEHSASFDAVGAQRDYAAAARPITLVDEPPRADSLYATWDRTLPGARLTLAAQNPDDSETWRWKATFNGEVLDHGEVDLIPNGNGKAVAEFSARVPSTTGIAFTAWKHDASPLRPGAWYFPWQTTHRATVATPVHRDHVEVRFDLATPEPGVLVQVQALDGTELGSMAVDLPRGTGRMWITRERTWPDVVKVRVGDLFPEGWLTTVHHQDQGGW